MWELVDFNFGTVIFNTFVTTTTTTIQYHRHHPEIIMSLEYQQDHQSPLVKMVLYPCIQPIYRPHRRLPQFNQFRPLLVLLLLRFSRMYQLILSNPRLRRCPSSHQPSGTTQQTHQPL